MSFWIPLNRGLRKRCPHCGKGRLFSGFAGAVERCPVCGLVYEPNAGDTWLFTTLGDRLPVAVAIAIVYFELGSAHLAVFVTALALLAAILIVTAPNRWGVGIALHYLSRRRWPDPNDPLPEDRRE